MANPNQLLEQNKNLNYLGFDKTKVTIVVKELNILLSNYHIYYQNLRNFHWNIKGENFFELHNQFEELYNDARIKIDEIAERILTLRHRPLSNLIDYLTTATISEALLIDEDRKMVLVILENHKTLIANLREVIKLANESDDEGTLDIVGGFLEFLEKKSWMLDAWANRKLKPTLASQVIK